MGHRKTKDEVFPSFSETEGSEGSGPVECLGMTFESDEARREYFLKRLKEKLRKPEFRNRPDFPIGENEDILRLSDPPYYTACPNPFLEDFIRHHGLPYDPDEPYHREPFAVDVSEGKTDPLYRAHSYHTKVPHLAIVPSILHYTKPGDVVLDGFCGSGMTGVAAQWCGTAPHDYRRRLELKWKEEGREKPEWGIRRVILGDLSPAATFIAGNYNIPFDLDAFEKIASQLLDEIEGDIGWMYETLHTDGKTKGRINYTVWSEVFSCPQCAGEVVFVREALDEKTGRVRKEFPCPHCTALVTKTRLDRLYVSQFDAARKTTVGVPKRVPILIEYQIEGKKHKKEPDSTDLDIQRRIEKMDWPSRFPTDRMMHAPYDTECWGDEWRPGVASFSHIHHLFLPRAVHALAAMWGRASQLTDHRTRNVLLFFTEQAIWGMSVLARYTPTHYSQVNQFLAGRIRVLSQHAECSPWYILRGKLHRLGKAFRPMPSEAATASVTTTDCAKISLSDNTVDYVFTDPPFGDNLAYAELNFLNEAFLRVFTNAKPEAIVSATQKKGLSDYRHLMERCFAAYYRILKPGRWMTVVFHSSKNSVWTAIQEALLAAGFMVADVRTLDKKQGTFNQVLTRRSVKQDLVISAYKPNQGLEKRFELEAGTEEGVWDFIRTHLRQLPVFVSKQGQAEVISERQAFLLFDRMVAFHVQRDVTLPLSAGEFYEGLVQRFAERDGMYLLPEQVAEYDRRRATVNKVLQYELFVRDEESARHWLRQELTKRPQSFQEIHPQFTKELGGWQKHEKLLDLWILLQDNYLIYDGTDDVPSQIHSYLSSNFKELRNLAKDDPTLRARAKNRWYVPDPRKASDLEKLRERGLLKEFQEYRDAKQKRLSVFRLEAVRAGFKKAWQERAYDTIIAVADKIPEKVLQEDPKLLMWFDQAVTRSGEDR